MEAMEAGLGFACLGRVKTGNSWPAQLDAVVNGLNAKPNPSVLDQPPDSVETNPTLQFALKAKNGRQVRGLRAEARRRIGARRCGARAAGDRALPAAARRRRQVGREAGPDRAQRHGDHGLRAGAVQGAAASVKPGVQCRARIECFVRGNLRLMASGARPEVQTADLQS